MNDMKQIMVFKDSMSESNGYCIEENGKAVIIDPNQGDIFLRLFQKKNWKPELILLTHEHCDHMQGLNKLRDYYDIQVVSTKECSANLADPVKNMSRLMGMYLHFRNGKDMPAPYRQIQCSPANVVFTETFAFSWRGHDFLMKALPGHTEGSCCIWMDENIFFSGDYLIPGEEVITRFPGGSQEQYEAVTCPYLEQLKQGIHVYPGHGKDYILERKR